jgi:SAM-dependent methyltransferase
LALYAQMVPSGFLNYGYFDQPETPPEKISLQDIHDAQVRYGRLLLEQMGDHRGAVLDAGCGMGGLLSLLLRHGCVPTALTPDRNQIRHIEHHFPHVPLIPTRFEALPLEQYRGRFQTVIMSESVQYMKLAKALPVVQGVLAPGGRWVLCDYFRLGETVRRSGHVLREFVAAVAADGWRIVVQRDITAHALPAIRFVHMLGRRAGLPALGFAVDKLQRRRPAIHYLLEDFFSGARRYAEQQLEVIDPEIFQREKAYMLMVLERA